MLPRLLFGMLLCELTTSLFVLLALNTRYVSAVPIPHLVLSTSSELLLDPGPPTRPRVPEAVSNSPSETETFIETYENGAPSHHSSSPSTTVTDLIARQTVPTDTLSSTTGQTTTTFSQPVADPSATFSDPFPPVPLPTQDTDVPPTVPVPQTDTGVPTWALGVIGAGIGVAVLLGISKLLVHCTRKSSSE